MDACRSVHGLRERWFVCLTLLAFGLAACTGGILWQALHTSPMAEVQARVEALQPAFTAVRMLVVALVALCWPGIIRLLSRWGRMGALRAARLQAWRWRVAAWLVVIELMLGQDLLQRFLQALQGGGA